MGGISSDKHSSSPPMLFNESIDPSSHTFNSQYNVYNQPNNHSMNDVDSEMQINQSSEPVIYSILQDSHYGDDLSFSKSESCLINRSSSSEIVHDITEQVYQKEKSMNGNYRDFATILFKLHKQEQSNLKQQNTQLEDRLAKLLSVLRKRQEIPENELTIELEQEVKRLSNRIQSLNQWKETVSREILSKMEMNLSPIESSLNNIKQLVQSSGLNSSLINIINKLLSNDVFCSSFIKSTIMDLVRLSRQNDSTLDRILKSLEQKSNDEISRIIDTFQDESLRNSLKEWIKGNISDESLVNLTLVNYDSILQDHKELLMIVKDAHEKMQMLEDSLCETENLHKQEILKLENEKHSLQEQHRALEQEYNTKLNDHQNDESSRELLLVQKDKQNLQNQLMHLQSEYDSFVNSNQERIKELQERLNASIKENSKLKKSCDEWNEKNSKWKEESDRLVKRLSQIEQQQKSNNSYKDKVSDLKQYQQELELKLDYLKNSFIQFARHRERQDSLLPVIATILNVSLDNFQPSNCGTRKSDNSNEFGNSIIDEITDVDNQQSVHFWPFW